MTNDSHPYEDKLLSSLGKIARSEEQSEGDLGQLEALLRGELSAADEETLARRASNEPDLSRALEAYRPLDDTAQQKIADRILDSLPQKTHSAPEPQTDVIPKARRAASTRKRRGWNLAWLAVPLVPLAAAAALALWLIGPTVEQAGLPTYTLRGSGGLSELRGPATTSVVELGPDSELTVLLRPSTAIEGAVDVRAYLSVDGALRPVDLTARMSSAGAIRLSGATGALFGNAHGEHELRVVVGRPELLRASAEQLASGTSDQGAGWQRLTLRLRLQAAP